VNPERERASDHWVVAQHAPHEGPGLLAAVLADAGIAMQVVRLDLGESLPEPDVAGGVVAMGGAMGVHDGAEHPWLETERRFLAAAVDAGVPVLGVCLGAQQLAAALGAAVTTGPEPEIGLGEVTLTAAGRADPVLGPEGDRVAAVHWHSDTFDIPDGAVRLASSTRYENQAFRLGSRVYGLQFHVEVDDVIAEAWEPELAPVVIERRALAAVQAAGARILRRMIRVASGR
jgi:GMP synthase (glutamine-hydrolysing)